MARRSDLVGFIRGLESITKALIETQGGEVQQAWKNSTLRPIVKDLTVKSEEVFSDAVSKQPELQVCTDLRYIINHLFVMEVQQATLK